MQHKVGNKIVFPKRKTQQKKKEKEKHRLGETNKHNKRKKIGDEWHRSRNSHKVPQHTRSRSWKSQYT